MPEGVSHLVLTSEGNQDRDLPIFIETAYLALSCQKQPAAPEYFNRLNFTYDREKRVETEGIDPPTSRMRSGRSTI